MKLLIKTHVQTTITRTYNRTEQAHDEKSKETNQKRKIYKRGNINTQSSIINQKFLPT